MFYGKPRCMSDLNSFLSCDYDLSTGVKNKFCQDNVFLSFFSCETK